jgi:hypothetical protein
MIRECGLVTELTCRVNLCSRVAYLDFNGNEFLDEITDLDSNETDLLRLNRRGGMRSVLWEEILSHCRGEFIEHHFKRRPNDPSRLFDRLRNELIGGSFSRRSLTLARG